MAHLVGERAVLEGNSAEGVRLAPPELRQRSLTFSAPRRLKT